MAALFRFRAAFPDEAAIVATPYANHPLWLALSNYSIGPPGVELSFTDRLARENGWTVEHASRVLEEYRRFCFLAVTAGHPVTPSDAVDQAWHLHLLYSHDYWEDFCPSVLGRPLHHCPTSGGDWERGRHFQQYAQTLKSYARVFGEDAPADLWPGAAQRLIEDSKARRFHPRDGLIITRRQAKGLALLAIAVLVAHVLIW